MCDAKESHELEGLMFGATLQTLSQVFSESPVQICSFTILDKSFFIFLV